MFSLARLSQDFGLPLSFSHHSFTWKWAFVSALLGLSLVTAESARGADWLHFGYDSSYTSHNPFETLITIDNIPTLERKWGIGCDDGWFSVMSRSPAIRDGILYSTSAGDHLHASNARTGEHLWEFGDSHGSGWTPQPTVSGDGTVFYLEPDGTIYALYAIAGATGSQLWQSPISFNLGFDPEALVTVDEANALVYMVEDPFIDPGKLFALNKQTGGISWYMGTATHDAAFAGSYVVLHDGKIYARAEVPIDIYPGASADKLLRIAPLTQTIEVAYDRPELDNYWGDIGNFVLCGERLIVEFDDHYDAEKHIVAYDAAGQASIAWRKELARESPFGTARPTFACNAQENLVYVPADPYLVALDVNTGAEVWRYQGYAPIYNPSVANGVIYFLSDTNMWAIDEGTQQQLLHWPLGYTADDTAQVAIDDGMLYFSGNGGTCDLFALGLPADPVPVRFDDVPPTHWAWPHIAAIANAGITNGCGPNRYCPGNPVSRAEMAAFLLRSIYGGGYSPPAATGARFSDVPASYWAAAWIEQLATEGITLGCGGGRYCPESTVTRAEMAVFLLRSKHGSTYQPPAATGTMFRDVTRSYWAASWIEQLASEGITGGCGNGNYCPDNSVTRAEMAVFLARTFNLPLPPRP